MGAFDFGPYKLATPKMGRLDDEPTTEELRVHWAVASFQKRLKMLGHFDREIGGVFGGGTENAVKKFQKQAGLKADGIIGRVTAKAILQPYTRRMQTLYGIPDNLICGQITQESGWDPAAVGAFTDPTRGVDRGLVQINSWAHPDIEDHLAFNAAFAIEYGAKRMRSTFRGFYSSLTEEQQGNADLVRLAWDCAVAGHNSPADANEWWTTGKPPDDQIRDYVAAIRRHCAA